MLKKNFQIIVSSNRIKAMKQLHTLGIIFISLAGCAIAIFQMCTFGIGLLEVGLLLFMYTICELGITVGYHRYFTHQAFKTSRAMRILFAIIGSMAGLGSVISWVSIHRCHHQYSDKSGDPHSPYIDQEVTLGKLHGLWHSHLGWLFNDQLPNSLVFAKDLLKDPVIYHLNRLYPLWMLLGLLIPTILAGVITRTWVGAIQGFLWGGIARLFFTFNSGCAINSITHTFGKRIFDTHEKSQNNILLAIATFGEGWHNNHHAFASSAKFGIKWWQIDLGYLVIRLLALFGLVWDVKVVPAEMIQSKKIQQAN